MAIGGFEESQRQRRRHGKGSGKGGGLNEPQHAGGNRGMPAQVKLNRAICEASDHNGIQGILDIIAASSHMMSLVNLSTALHRLGTLTEDRSNALAGDPRFEALCAQARAELDKQVNFCNDSAPRCWATIAWSYAKLQHSATDVTEVLKIIAALSEPHIAKFKPFELTNLLWASVKAKVIDSKLFDTARKHIEGNVRAFSRSSLSTLAWTFATAQHPSQKMLQSIAAQFIGLLGNSEVHSVELANLMWGLATAQIRLKPTAYQAIGTAAMEVLPKFKLHELSIFLWSFSRVGVRHDELFFKSAVLLTESPERQRQVHPQGIANILWACGKQVEFNSSVTLTLVTAFHALLPVVTWLLPHMKPQELSCVMWATTKLGCIGEQKNQTDYFFAALAQTPDAWFSQFPLTHRVQILKDSIAVSENLTCQTASQAQSHARFASLCSERLYEADPKTLTEILEMSHKPVCYQTSEIYALVAEAAHLVVSMIDAFSEQLRARVSCAAVALPGELQEKLSEALAKPSDRKQEFRHLSVESHYDNGRLCLDQYDADDCLSTASPVVPSLEVGTPYVTHYLNPLHAVDDGQVDIVDAFMFQASNNIKELKAVILEKSQTPAFAETSQQAEADFVRSQWSVKNTFVTMNDCIDEKDEMVQVRLKAHNFRSEKSRPCVVW